MTRRVALAVAAIALPLAAASRTAPPAPDGTDDLRSCLIGECHGSLHPTAHAHPPVAKGVCRICHRPKATGAHEFDLARDGRGLCSFCHREIEPGANAHNDLLGVDCITCHDPHGTGRQFLLPAPRTADLCEGCHGDLIDERSFLHAPVVGGPCTTCHDPHGTVPGPTPADGAEFCFRCHEEVRNEIDAAPIVHEPMISADCATCHDPHGSDDPASLLEPVPALCYRCHEEIRERVETSAHGHSVAGEPGGCLACHTPHVSSGSFLLRSDPLTVCSACHSDELTTDDGETLDAVAQQIATSAYLHGPIRQRDCSGCHDSHGSEHPRLLVEHYSTEFYARFDLENYRLCFSCHPQRKVLTEQTSTLTGFRNGDSNLHYVHVTKPTNGRTCRACHATHGSNAPKHIGESVKYGAWKLPIAFTMTETGGHCDSGCHQPRAYDREAPVDYGTGTAGGPPE